MILSLDTETTGVDLWHGALPYLVTVCREDGEQLCWEWDVDPKTRRPVVPREDVREVESLLREADTLVLQNPKFDCAGLRQIGVRDFPWGKVEDTLTAGHVLASNQPHDLDSMAVFYLGEGGKAERENELAEACKAARRTTRLKAHAGRFDDWVIAREGVDSMPSVRDGKGKEDRGGNSERPWKNDTWLPRAVARELGFKDGHPWFTVARDYANTDSAIALALWGVMQRELHRRGLWKVYKESLKRQRLAHLMEWHGVTIHADKLDTLLDRYQEEIAERERVCVSIAAGYGHDLVMPKGSANNKSMESFCFDVLRLPALKVGEKSGKPSLDKHVLAAYHSILQPRGKPLAFVRNLQEKRLRDTQCGYLRSYRKFGVPEGGNVLRLHPSLNPTGTDTLRWSHSNPNEANVSKRESNCRKCNGEGCDRCGLTGMEIRSVRWCFGPAPGREWWVCDAKNIELRLPAYESGEAEMIALFERPDDPPFYGSNHMLIFSVLWPELWEAAVREVGLEKAGPYCKKRYADTQYQWTKNGNFAVQYGAIDREDGLGTADLAYHQPGAQAKIKARFKKLEELNRRWVRFAEERGYVETMPDREVDPTRGYPLLCTRTEYGRVLPTVPLNYHIQGTAMQWMAKAMSRCQGKLDEWNDDCGIDGHYRTVLQVHDELVFDFPRSEYCPVKEAERLKKNPRGFRRPDCNLHKARVLRRLMEQGGQDIGVPTPVSLGYHPDNWSEGVDL